MNRNQILGLTGSIILFVGVFTPIMSVPILGNMNYFQNGRGDGVVVLVLSLISLLLTLAKKYRGLLITGALSLAVLAFTFINFQWRLSEMRAKVKTDLANNPFSGLGEAFLGNVQIQWGWAVLIVGAAILLFAGFLKADAVRDNEPSADALSAIEGPLTNNRVLGILIGAVVLLGVGFVVATTIFQHLPAVGDIPGVRQLSETERTKDQINSVLSVSFVDKGYQKADYESGTYLDALVVKFRFVNNGNKKISGFKGTAVFEDMFGDRIKSTNLSYDEEIAPGSSVDWTGSLNFNQFISEDVKLRDVGKDKLQFKFEPKMVMFADGSKLEIGKE
jgi:hypothetical protein